MSAARFDVLVRGGTVVAEGGTVRADVGIRDGRIADIAERLGGSADRVIDAAGRLVLPGGVDSHCHLEQIAGDGSLSADDFFTGSQAAACGGTTTIVSFASQLRGQSARDVVAAYHARAGQRAGIDYSFHIIVSDPTDEALAVDLPALIAAGHRSIKVFTCYAHRRFGDDRMLALMEMAARNGALMMVHAENHDACAFASDRLIAAGKVAPRYHADGRPALAEREAVQSVLALAELSGAAVLIAHVTAAQVLAEVERAVARGLPVRGETCPQYLMFTRDFLDAPFEVAVRRMCSPPFREEADREALWQALAAGGLQLATSDHAPTNAVPDESRPFTGHSNGLPGLETRLPVLFSEGVVAGRLSLERFAALTATNPAKTFGLYPRKGAIRLGADADLAIWDPERRVTIRAADLHHAVAYTPFEGLDVTGWPVMTMLRGRVVMEDGQPSVVAGEGRFLPQERSCLFDRPDAPQ